MGSLNLKTGNGIAVIEFDQPGAKVNTLDASVMREFSSLLDEVSAKAGGEIKALVIASAKEGVFIAGADIKAIANLRTEEEALAVAAEGQKILDKLEALPVPTVAAINGACLGGGFELALACKYRVAGSGPKVKIGLPEVNLGILPGWGGTQRLPRLAGLSSAVDMILAGKIISGKDALKRGIVDRLWPEPLLRAEAAAFAASLPAGPRQAPPRKTALMQSFLDGTAPGRALLFSQTRKKVLEKTKGFYPAPLKALRVIQETFGGDLAAGLEKERQALAELAVTGVSRNLVKLFFLTEKFKKLDWASGAAPGKVRKCAVSGAGIMGGGIAQVASSKDIPVRVKDISFPALQQALKTADGIYRSALKRRKLNKYQAAHRMALISPTLTYDGFKNSDIVVEAVVEDIGIKRKVFAELEANTAPGTVLVSNTSSLTIADIGAEMKDRTRLAGMHFFNPVHRMPLVEVIRTAETSPKTLATVVAFARELGKTVVVVKDSPGFLVNRILVPYLNEAAFLVQEGMAIERVDGAARGFGMPMGPVELIDEVGIDVGAKVAKIFHEAFGERMSVSAVLEAAKAGGLLGKKKGLGFYRYSDGRKGAVNEEIYKLIPERGQRFIEAGDAVKRMIYGMVNEAARCLDEGIVDDPEAIDLAMIMGTGFPPFRGGLWRYAEETGLAAIADELERLAKEFDAPRLAPCDYLKKKARG
ncbi:MAG: 3-hydroxyacyl-CoA dehydrogenase NAD-binding domain-containing protein [Elusimicrobia bacterium]|nr:3-hydroxyacyl-CoA dehydrogenase NAD-binding domain-containing protein [Elusimicrobiota bacterium]